MTFKDVQRGAWSSNNVISYWQAGLRGRLFRLLFALAACVFFSTVAFGSPERIFTSVDPARNGGSPKPDAINQGDGNVSTQTGAFTYTYPIVVPPGRQDAFPSLSLQYSSQGPIYGTLATGWSMSLPTIQRDPRDILPRWRAVSTVFDIELFSRRPERYKASLSGNLTLRPVDERVGDDVLQSYRAEVDSQFVRYERLDPEYGNGHWRARTLDGKVYSFAEPGHNVVRDPFFSSVEKPVGGVFRLTSIEDIHGNRVEFFWKPIARGYAVVDHALARIEYATNPDAGLEEPFARVSISSEVRTCDGTDLAIGATLDYRFGARAEPGSSTITEILTEVRDGNEFRPVRRYELGYDENGLRCDGAYAPLRLLQSVQETAYAPDGGVSTRPATTFEYGKLTRSFVEDRSGLLGMQTPIGGLAITSGLRQGSGGDNWASLSSMMIDFDGDGLVDNVYADPGEGCSIQVRRNNGAGFEQAFLVQLPRAKWASGGKGRNQHERCSLSAQYTQFRNKVWRGDPQRAPRQSGSYLVYRYVDVHGDGRPDLIVAPQTDFYTDPSRDEFLPYDVPACTGPQVCFRADQRCAAAAVSESGDAGDIGKCRVVTSCPANINMLQSRSAPTGGGLGDLGEPLDPADPDLLPPPGYSGRSPHRNCKGYPWAIYTNTGNGFAADPKVVVSPIPLEVSGGGTQFGATTSGFFGVGHGLFDINADGFPDAVIRNVNSDFVFPMDNAAGKAFFVFLGDGNGGFDSRPYGLPYNVAVPSGSHLSASWAMDVPPRPVLEGNQRTAANGTFETIVDLNGDGLPDLLRPEPGFSGSSGIPDGLYAYFNRGDEFNWVGQGKPGKRFHPELSFAGRSIVAIDEQSQVSLFGNMVATRVASYTDVRLLDYDADGRIDLFAPSPVTNSGSVLFGRGDGSFDRSIGQSQLVFQGGPHRLDGNDAGAVYYSSNDGDIFGPAGAYSRLPWVQLRGFLDITGDGYPDAIDMSTLAVNVDIPTDADNLRLLTDDYGDHPPRLLKSVDNGRGLVTLVGYAQHNFGGVVDNEGGDTVPTPFFVVKDLRRTDGLCDPSAAAAEAECEFNKTDYRYTSMVHNDADGYWRFRGFERAESRRADGSGQVNMYDYSVDATGRLSSTYRLNAEGHANAVEETAYEKFELFDGRTASFLVGIRRQFRCQAAQTPEQCRQQENPSVTEYGYHGIFDDAQPDVVYAYALSGSMHRMKSSSSTEGDKRAKILGKLYVSPERYIYREVRRERHEWTRNGWKRIGVEEDEWADDGTVKLAHIRWSDPNTKHETQFEYHPNGVGAVVARRHPEQVAASGPAEQYSYNEDFTYIRSTTNEVGHNRDRVVDIGTGRVIEEFGPNRDENGARTHSRYTIDGFGRTLLFDTTRDAGDGTYVMDRVRETKYVDDEIPSRIVQRRRRSFSNDTYVLTEQAIDGLNRKRSERHSLGGDRWAESRYEYDQVGRLSAYSAPHPDDDSLRVEYHYTYDGFDRIVATALPVDPASNIERYDPDMPNDGAAYLTGYDGYTTTTSEYATENTAPNVSGDVSWLAMKRSTVDPFGRVVLVEERLEGNTLASTSYSYDGNDRLLSVVDAEGVLTEFEYDWLGRRTAIIRGERKWSFEFDLNGMVTKHSYPGAPGPDAEMHNQMSYDALGRLISETVSSNELDEAEAALFAIGETTYVYDDCENGVGNLCRVVLPRDLGAISYGYDARLNRDEVVRDISIPGASVRIKRSSRIRFNTLGQISELWLPDDRGTGDHSHVVFEYDARGLLVSARLHADTGLVDLVHLQRNLAGQIVERTVLPGNSANDAPVSTWVYDALGRVTMQNISRLGDAGSRTIVEQRLAYSPMGEIATLAHELNGFTAEFEYNYDSRHQLTSVQEAATGFAATWAYGEAGRMRSAMYNSQSRLPREVIYRYEDPNDPERLTRLENARDPGDFATYAFDERGNLTSRISSDMSDVIDTGDTLSFSYDGKNRHVAMIGSSGRERYYYDHNGSRMLAIRDIGNATGIDDIRHWFGGVEEHLGADGTVEKTTARVELGQPAVRIERRGPNASRTVSQVYHSTLSHLLASVDEQGVVRAGFVYGPFGEIIRDAGAPEQIAEHSRRFNGKELDQRSNLYYYGARYYDPISLIWTQGDPLHRFVPELAVGHAQPRRANLYSFSLNNPMRYIDADGLDATASVHNPDPDGDLGPSPHDICNDPFVYCNEKERTEGEHAKQQEMINEKAHPKERGWTKEVTPVCFGDTCISVQVEPSIRNEMAKQEKIVFANIVKGVVMSLAQPSVANAPREGERTYESRNEIEAALGQGLAVTNLAAELFGQTMVAAGEEASMDKTTTSSLLLFFNIATGRAESVRSMMKEAPVGSKVVDQIVKDFIDLGVTGKAAYDIGQN